MIAAGFDSLILALSLIGLKKFQQQSSFISSLRAQGITYFLIIAAFECTSAVGIIHPDHFLIRWTMQGFWLRTSFSWVHSFGRLLAFLNANLIFQLKRLFIVLLLGFSVSGVEISTFIFYSQNCSAVVLRSVLSCLNHLQQSLTILQAHRYHAEWSGWPCHTILTTAIQT